MANDGLLSQRGEGSSKRSGILWAKGAKWERLRFQSYVTTKEGERPGEWTRHRKEGWEGCPKDMKKEFGYRSSFRTLHENAFVAKRRKWKKGHAVRLGERGLGRERLGEKSRPMKLRGRKGPRNGSAAFRINFAHLDAED